MLGRRLTAIFCDPAQRTKAENGGSREDQQGNNRKFGQTNMPLSFIWRNVSSPHMEDDEVAAPKRCDHRSDENKPQGNSLGHLFFNACR
nr:putative integron gene cassette protein [uncultured bacterium]